MDQEKWGWMIKENMEFHEHNVPRTPGAKMCGKMWTSTSFGEPLDDDQDVMSMASMIISP